MPTTISRRVRLPRDVDPWVVVRIGDQMNTEVVHVRAAYAVVETTDGIIERSGQQALKDALAEVRQGDELLSAEVTSEVTCGVIPGGAELSFTTQWRPCKRGRGSAPESSVTVKGTNRIAVEGAKSCLKDQLRKRHVNGLVEPSRPMWQRMITGEPKQIIAATIVGVLTAVIIYFLGIQ